MDEIRWLKPLRPGETITGIGEVVKKTPSKSRPEIGSLVINYEVFNKKNELIMTLVGISIFKKKYLSKIK